MGRAWLSFLYCGRPITAVAVKIGHVNTQLCWVWAMGVKCSRTSPASLWVTGAPDTVEHYSEACVSARLFPQDLPAASWLFTAHIATQITAHALGTAGTVQKRCGLCGILLLTTQVSHHPATYGDKVTVMSSRPIEKYLHVHYVVQESDFMCTEKYNFIRTP